MAKFNTAELPIEWEKLPLGYLARSYDGHLFEIDINRYNGLAYVKYPAHLPTLSAVREVICALSDGMFFDDLLDDFEKMPERDYCGFCKSCDYELVRSADGMRIVDAEGSEVESWK